MVPAMVRMLTHTATTALLLALTGCGDGGDSSSSTAPAPAPATQPACSDLLKPGQKIDQAKAEGGCLDPAGDVRVLGAFRCNNGRNLWLADASTGAPAGWGFGDGEFTAAPDAASDPGFRKAYQTCKSA